MRDHRIRPFHVRPPLRLALDRLARATFLGVVCDTFVAVQQALLTKGEQGLLIEEISAAVGGKYDLNSNRGEVGVA